MVIPSPPAVLALSTMFTEDLFAYYGGRRRFGAKAEVWAGRGFIVLIGAASYVIALALKDQANIFELAIRFAFSGFAALAPVMLAALFWKRSTKWGALAAGNWVVFGVLASWWLNSITEAKSKAYFAPPKPPVAASSPAGALSPASDPVAGGIRPAGTVGDAAQPSAPPLAVQSPSSGSPGAPPVAGPSPSASGGSPVGAPSGPGVKAAKPKPPFEVFPGNPYLLRTPTNVTLGGYLFVFPMVVGSALLMIIVSLLTPAPSAKTLEKYFPSAKA